MCGEIIIIIGIGSTVKFTENHLRISKVASGYNILILNLHATMLYALFIGPVMRCELLENLFAQPLFNVINGCIVYIP